MIEFKKMIDTEKHLWCREAALVRVTGGRGALTSAWYEETDDYTVKSHLLLNGKPIVQGEYPECPTCCALLARGYGIEKSDCEELKMIRDKINSDYTDFRTALQNIEPILDLLDDGYYVVADAKLYPTDGSGHFFILNTNLDYKIDEGLNPRILEKDQMIQLCNIIAEELLIGKYDTEIGTYRLENKITEGKGNSIPDSHLIACRMFREEVMYNWVQYLKLLINNYFATTGMMYDSDNLFQQPIPDMLWINIRNFIHNLSELPVWRDRSMAATIFGGKQNYEYWKSIFKTASTPDGKQVLANPLNTIEMIRR